MEKTKEEMQKQLDYQQGEIVALSGVLRRLLVNLPDFTRDKLFSDLRLAIQTGEDMAEIRASILGPRALALNEDFVNGIHENLHSLTAKIDS